MVGDWGTNGSATTETGGDAPGRHGRAVAVAVTLVLLSLAVILDQRAPAAMGPDAQATTFSSLRAMDHLEQIAAEPHAVTQVGHARSRDYIVAQLRSLGWQTHVQAGTVDGEPTVYNVVGRLAGTDSTGAIMIAGHYDSVSAGPGAADDGLAVASMVEVARALAEGPRLRNDVILNFTDGEEAGLLGAQAFLADPRVPRSALALNVNLDMVGHSATGELWAVGAARHSALRPVLEALQQRAAVRLRLGHDRPGIPGEKDWTGDSDHAAFHAAGIPFVYFGVEDHEDYHRPSDDPETLTPAFFAGAVKTILEGLRLLDAALP